MKILFISYYFPPCGPGWAMRTVNFIRHLSKLGWNSIVLTVKEEYYKENLSVAQVVDPNGLPEQIEVVRTDSWEPKEAVNHPELTALSRASAPRSTRTESLLTELSLKSRLIFQLTSLIERFILIPDVKILWLPKAFLAGKRLVRGKKPDVIFASLPVFSVGLIGWTLKKATGKPLVVDFRDDWAANPAYRHPDAWGRWLNNWCEKKVVEAADLVILVTKQSLAEFTRRYPGHSKFMFLPNGYDPRLEKAAKKIEAEKAGQPIRLVHSGYVALERDPSGFFEVMAEWLNQESDLASRLRVVWVGSVERRYLDMADNLGLKDLFEFTGPLPYEENLQHLAGADAFLLLPSHNAPNSIPGKLYEYLFLRKPILAISPENASVELLKEWNWGLVADPSDKKAIKERLTELLKQIERPDLLSNIPTDELVKTYSRSHQTKQLAQRLERIIESYE